MELQEAMNAIQFAQYYSTNDLKVTLLCLAEEALECAMAMDRNEEPNWDALTLAYNELGNLC